MVCKKSLLICLAMFLALSGEAGAQGGAAQIELDVLRAQQSQLEQRDILRQNEMMALETRRRADDAVNLMQWPSIQGSPLAASAPLQPASGMIAIPDAALAASRARVEAVTRARR
ncbi:hypothetical protein [Phenylobacterium immobile]|uniref:hypothetical protein n=1 Tax=Phenylobacterium immobile TaxID=21 RepID=UPI00159EEE0D|nr:hypothetical protein [Phenylobacterium immobile]